MSIGEKLKKIRLSRGLSQSELAGKVGVTQSMIAQIERGTKAFNLELAKEVSEVLNCSVNDFYESA